MADTLRTMAATFKTQKTFPWGKFNQVVSDEHTDMWQEGVSLYVAHCKHVVSVPLFDVDTIVYKVGKHANEQGSSPSCPCRAEKKAKGK